MKYMSSMFPIALVAMALIWTGCDDDDNDVVESDPQPTIVEVAEEGGFSTLVAAIEAANLVTTLESDGPFTVFAPTDEAFAALPDGTLDSLLEPDNRDQLTSILTYHVVPGRVPASDVVSLSTAKTVQGADVSISVSDGTVMINGATVLETDIEASNGIIHVIDSVLLPPSDASKRGGPAAVRGPGNSAATASDSGTLNVVHLIPGATVDVCVQGGPFASFAKAITDFEFGSVETFELPAGDYDANVVLAGNDCAEPIPGLSASGVTLPAGANASVTANLDAGGDVELNVFVNDLSTDGNGPRVAVRHAAAAPAVDVWVGRNVQKLARTFENVSNGQGAEADVRPGRLSAALSLPGGDDVIYGPQDLTLRPFTYYEVYAAGTFPDTFTLVVNAIPLK